MINIFLLEDHTFYRQAFAFLLEREENLKVVAQAGSLEESRRATSHIWPEVDIAIIDLLLPDGSGTELIHEMREVNPNVQVLAITVAQEAKTLREAREMGVDEVISKAAPMEGILCTVRRLTANQPAAIGR